MATLTPADVATWPAPNYDHPHTRVPELAGIEISFGILMTAFIVTRFYGRKCITNALGADDWVMLAAWLFTLSQTVNNLMGIPNGNARHLWDVRPENIPTAMKGALIAQALFPAAAGLTKISVCLTYLRIFPSSLNKYFCYTAIGYEICWGIACTLVGIFMCRPISLYWDVTSTHGTCVNEKAFLISSAALNNMSDFFIFLWPARFLWNIQIPMKQRLGLILMFGLGSLVCVAGVCRMWYFTIYFASYDAFWEGAIIYSIVAIETDLGVIFGCLPGCKPVAARCFPALGSSGVGGSSAPSKSQRAIRTFGSATVGGSAGTGRCKSGVVELKEFRQIEDVREGKEEDSEAFIKQEREFWVEVEERSDEEMGGRAGVSTRGSGSGSGSRKSMGEGVDQWEAEKQRRASRREANIYTFS